MSIALSALITARLSAAVLRRRRREHDVEVLEVDVSDVVALAQFLRDDPDAACELLDLTIVDRFGVAAVADAARFLLVVMLVSRQHQTRARLEVVLDRESPTWPTLSNVWPAAWLYEREAMDLFGVVADGHTDPQRLILPEGFAGHPLRLDYRITKRQLSVPSPERGPRVVIDDPPAREGDR